MNIIIDARMVDKNLHGIGRYTFELIKGLISKNDISLKLITNNEKLSREIFGNEKKITYLNMKSKFLSPMEIIEFPIILNKYKKNHIFHSPSFSSSPFIKVKSFITIHDLNHLALPQYYTKFHKYYYKFIVKPFALKCEKIFTVSYFSKKEIINWLKCNGDKIIVTYNGIDKKFRLIEDVYILDRVKKKYNLPEEFILYIGNLKQHKNVKTLVRSMEGIDKSIKLVINGYKNDELDGIIRKYNLGEKIQFIGYVDDDDLPALYNLAKTFVFPSIYEGFGLPTLEAMACGCNVISSNIDCLVEILGDKAQFFNPLDYKDLQSKIERCTDIDKEDNIKYARNFNWNNTIIKTIGGYYGTNCK